MLILFIYILKLVIIIIIIYLSVSEIVLNDITGITTEVDVQQIADALENLVSNPGLCAQLGNAAQEFTLANFGVQRLVNEHEELYKKLLANQAKS